MLLSQNGGVTDRTGDTSPRGHGLQRISQNQVISSTWTPSFFVYDGGGTVRKLTSISGSVTDTYDYDAFGNLVNSTGTTPNYYLYRGEQYDPDLGLYYLRARYYNPATGRFISRDPDDHDPRNPNQLHKYLYAGGDAIDQSDPTGRGADEQYAFTVGKRTIIVSARALEFAGSLTCAFSIDVYIITLLEEPNKIDITLGGIGVLSGCGLAALPYYLIALE